MNVWFLHTWHPGSVCGTVVARWFGGAATEPLREFSIPSFCMLNVLQYLKRKKPVCFYMGYCGIRSVRSRKNWAIEKYTPSCLARGCAGVGLPIFLIEMLLLWLLASLHFPLTKKVPHCPSINQLYYRVHHCSAPAATYRSHRASLEPPSIIILSK